MGPRTIKKRRPVSCPNLAAGRPYFANYMNTIQDTALLDTSIERYCPCGHFEYKNNSIRSFWSKIWSIEGPKITHNLAFSRPSKSVFTISSLVCCDKTIHSIVRNFFVVLYILETLEVVKNRRLYFFKAKNAKKWKSENHIQLRGIFQDPL